MFPCRLVYKQFNEWGNQLLPNGTMPGLIGGLSRNEANISFTPIIMFPDRLDWIDFAFAPGLMKYDQYSFYDYT